jgi:hypothetical protein
MPGNVGHGSDVGIVALPAVPVATAESRGFDGNNDAVGWWGWVGETFDGERTAKGVERDGAHYG